MTMNRREFLRVAVLGSGALAFGVSFPGCSRARRRMQNHAAATGEFRPNMFLTITPDSRVLVDVEKSEMGQGIWTSHAMLVAEELGVDVERIETSSADSAPEYQTYFGLQLTGGSTSASGSFVPVRKAAASAREMLIQAAAIQWGVDPGECQTTGDCGVRHIDNGREIPFGELTTAAAEVPMPDEPAIKDIEDFEVLGTESRRVDGVEKVDGSAVFGIDVDVPNKVCATCIRPPVFGAEPEAVGADDARRMDGVIDVVTLDFGVAVVAETYWQARRAAATVDVQWSGALMEGLDSDQIHRAAKRACKKEGHEQYSRGDVDILDRRGPTVVDAEYSGPYLAHAPMEPQNTTVHVRDGEVDVWSPTQAPTVVQEAIARAVGVARSDVHVRVPLLGGGFGRRAVPDVAVEAALIAEHFDRPVQLIWSREEDTRGGYYRPINHNRLRGAVDGDGNVVAWSYHHVSQTIVPDTGRPLGAVFPEWIPMRARGIKSESLFALIQSGGLPEVAAMEGAIPPYAIDNVKLAYTPIRTPVPVTFWRSVGHSHNGFVVESFIDELAHAAGEDPYEFRRRLLVDDPALRRVLDRAAEEADWGSALPKGVGRGIAAHESFESPVAQVVEAGLGDDGSLDIRRVICVIDCGIALNPNIVCAQMEGGILQGLSAAIGEKVTFTDGRIDQGNFDDYPLLTMSQAPDVEVHIVETSDEPTGVGEPGLPPAAPALANAIFDATGIRLRHMPFRDELASLLDED